MQTDSPQANPEYGSPIFKKPPVSVSDFSKKIDATQGGKEKPLVTPTVMVLVPTPAPTQILMVTHSHLLMFVMKGKSMMMYLPKG